MASQYLQSTLPGIAPPRRLRGLRALVLDRLARSGRAVWHGLEALGQRRADRELLALAERWREINPKLSRELRSYVRGGSSY